MSKERRFISRVELRADSQGAEMVLTGYAAKFNTESQDLGGFREVIKPGAFARAIRERQDVRALVNHDPNQVLGRTTNGTLKLEEDNIGLRFRVVLPNTQAARDAYTLVQRGDVSGCSFAFLAKDQSWEDKRDANGDLYACRSLLDVDLLDVSPVVTYPAYEDTNVGADNDKEYDAVPFFNAARSIFPEGVPSEVRNHVPNLRNINVTNSRRNFTNKILSL